jgi:hypothetical protein
MSEPLSGLLTDRTLLLALVVLFGGGVSAGMLGLLAANAYFLPGPPPTWSLRAGAAVAVLGAVLTGLGLLLLVLDGTLWGAGDAAPWMIAAGVLSYVAGVVMLEVRSRPDTSW